MTDNEFDVMLDKIENSFFNEASRIVQKHCMDIEHY